MEGIHYIKKIGGKALIIITFLFSANTFTSCFNFCDNVKHYDFHTIAIRTNSNIITSKDTLSLYIDPTDLNYFSLNENGLFTFNSAYGLTCDDGWGGMKNPVTKIEITSDKEFSPDLPANSILNEIVLVKNTDSTMVSLDSNPILDFPYLCLYIKERPISVNFHTLSIKVFKSNGEVLTATSAPIEWEK